MKLMLFWHAGGVGSYYERYKNLANEYSEVKVIIPKAWNEGGKIITIKEKIALKSNCEIIPVDTKFNVKQTTFLYDFNQVQKHVKGFIPDVIHIHEEPWAFSTHHIIKQCEKLFKHNFKIVVDSAAINMKRRFFPFSLFEKTTYSKAHLIFARNKEVIDILRKRGYRGKISLLGNGVDTTIFQREGSFKDKHNIVFIGRLTKSKGVFLLLNAFREIIEKQEYNEITLSFVGSGDAQTELKRLVEKYDLTNKINFIDRVDSEKVVDYITKSRVLVLPSISTKLWKEQFGRVLVETLVVGRPVIGSSCGEIPNVIGNTQYIFQENNAEDLVKKIEFVLNPNNQNIIDDDIENMRNEVIKKYDWSNLARYHIQEILKLTLQAN